ncbi:MAG: NAD(P)H-hydrate dehydratase [Phycisphaerales bacterium]
MADPESKAVLAIGPGVGLTTRAVGRRCWQLAAHGGRKIILDADGLNLLARTARPRPNSGGEIVLTPHPGGSHAWPNPGHHRKPHRRQHPPHRRRQARPRASRHRPA